MIDQAVTGTATMVSISPLYIDSMGDADMIAEAFRNQQTERNEILRRGFSVD